MEALIHVPQDKRAELSVQFPTNTIGEVEDDPNTSAAACMCETRFLAESDSVPAIIAT